MKTRVIILMAFFILFYAGCSEKQEAIVDSGSNQQSPTEMPAEVKSLLDQYTIPDGVDLPEIVAAPADFDLSSINDSIYDVYLVAFLWGELLNVGPPINIPLDWSGSLSVNGPSFVKTVNPVDFERGEDSLVPDNQSSAEYWASYTDNDLDGLLFLVLYDKVTPTFAPQILTFTTSPITLQFNFDQLIHLFAYYQVDPVNSVAVAARKIRLHRCREGYFSGEWRKSDTSDFTGNFEGLWFSRNSDTLGVLSGHFWKNNDGVQLLEGWVSGLYTDQIIAELHGHWFFDDYRMCPICGASHGQIKGRFKTVDGDAHGYFMGVFGDYDLPPERRTMPLHGRWQLDCVNLVPNDDPAGN